MSRRISGAWSDSLAESKESGIVKGILQKASGNTAWTDFTQWTISMLDALVQLQRMMPYTTSLVEVQSRICSAKPCYSLLISKVH